MTSRQRFLAAAHRQETDQTPVWVMRQAGRYLPEYRALKEKYSFTEMVRSPELATEVTLQPLRRYALDAAIIFSDILIIPEALGQPYHFRDGGGIGMDFIIDSPEKIAALDPTNIEEKLAYLPAALKLTRNEIGDEKALLGFAGSPWTLAAYMTEGGSLKDCLALKTLYYKEPAQFEALMEKLVASITDLIKMKIAAGVDAIQIFDSAGAYCPAGHYEDMSMKWIRRIIDALPADFPVILFAKGMAHQKDALVASGASILSLDWTVDLPSYYDDLPANIAVQGNLDPIILSADADIVRAEARRLLSSMEGRHGHILNLGHGILPSAKPENMQVLMETIAEFKR
ncbi:uroporphyrinogen decarboxylase [Persicirhabdus sediminis]|uniref:Uroporphyrinogen decarboxylase n=1 Tax=Persicirhabdus sediminis TaxID=454144 RepID=A0A8J7SNI6_9BACT|nr:uroporphyrinogen decarboxylase [Persicirhabdus sediminis]MBK1792715.1 uroporphyrinogen decarboxylase [Persicirhabdus sediminis]